MKRIFLTSTISLSVVLIFLLIYNIAFRKDPARDSRVANDPQPIEEKFSDAAAHPTNAINPLTNEAVFPPSLDATKEKLRFYEKRTGLAYEMDLDGTNRRPLSNDTLPDLRDVQWSQDTQKTVTQFFAGGAPSFYSYNYETDSATRLKNGIDAVKWSSVGSQILYKYFDAQGGTRSLNIANADGSNWKKLTDISFRKIAFEQVPPSSLVAYWPLPDAFVEGTLSTVSIAGGTPSPVFAGRFGVAYSWSPDGQTILLSSTNERGGSLTGLATINARGGEYRHLAIPTFAEKTAWSQDGKTVYYALPGAIPDTAILPNDYTSGTFFTQDTFWKVDVTSGKTDRLVPLEKIVDRYDATHLLLSPTENALFFINRIDEKLYRIDL